MKRGLEKFNELTESFAKLPGVGKKSAARFAYFVCMQDSFAGLRLAQNIEDAVRFIKRCERCGGLSENEICDICSDESRDSEVILLVESPKDILVFEQNGIYNGPKEVVFAFTPGLNSDALMLYVEDKLGMSEISFSKIAQGVPTGVNLENVDMLSLLKAYESRTKA